MHQDRVFSDLVSRARVAERLEALKRDQRDQDTERGRKQSGTTIQPSSISNSAKRPREEF